MKSKYFVLLHAGWYLLFFAKFHSHCDKNEKVTMEKFVTAAVLITDQATLIHQVQVTEPICIRRV